MTAPTPAPATPRIFVSHAHQDDAFCLRLIADLRERLGEDAVWYDTSGGLHGSDQWWDRILAEITERPYFLVVLSPSASASRWVPEEMAIAYRQKVELGKRLLPVRLADSPRREDWKGTQEFDFTAPNDPARYAAALNELLAVLGVDPAHRAPAAAPVGDRPLSRVEQFAREANTAYGRQAWSDVLDKTDLLIERDAMTPDLWRKRASAAEALRDPRASEAIAKALASDPDDVDTLMLQGRIFTRDGDGARAAATYLRAFQVSGIDDIASRLTILEPLCDALKQQRRWEDLARRAHDAQRLAPEDPRWPRDERDALASLSRPAEALTIARALTARPGATASDHLALAHLLKATAAPESAIAAALDAAARLTPNGASDPAIAQARRDLFPPPIPPERFPARLASLGFTPHARDGQEWILPPLVAIPAGQFRLGSDKTRDKDARDDELKRVVVDLPAFQIARFPVTVAEYACFVRAGHAAPRDWATIQTKLDHPVTTTTWYDAYDYAAWLAQRTGQPWRLPTEAEWEKAARLDPRDPLGASSARVYPWGDAFDQSRCNTSGSNLKGTSPVGWYGPDNPDPRAGRQSGASPCGVEEMAGNVWEWTATIYAADYTHATQQAARDSTGNRALRGGSWLGNPIARACGVP